MWHFMKLTRLLCEFTLSLMVPSHCSIATALVTWFSPSTTSTADKDKDCGHTVFRLSRYETVSWDFLSPTVSNSETKIMSWICLIYLQSTASTEWQMWQKNEWRLITVSHKVTADQPTSSDNESWIMHLVSCQVSWTRVSVTSGNKLKSTGVWNLFWKYLKFPWI